MNNKKSVIETQVEEKLLKITREITEKHTNGDTLPLTIVKDLLQNEELKAIHDYANIVSITRIGLNDHGPVHMKKVCYNAIKMLRIMHEAGIETTLEKDGCGTFADSLSAVILASLMHDSGMTIARKNHEIYSGIIAYKFIDELLARLLPGENAIMRRVVIRSVAMEGILGHMGTNPIHSLEAGIILASDGCDMTKGRAHIPLEIPSQPTQGDIHKYSANSIDKVKIVRGTEKPIRIEISMQSEVGFFQVEEVLIPKISVSPIRSLLEIFASVKGEEVKRYW